LSSSSQPAPLKPDRIYGAPEIPQGYKIYVEESYNYLLAYPVSWTLSREGEDTRALYFMDPQSPYPDEPVAGVIVQPPYRDLTGVAETAEGKLSETSGVGRFVLEQQVNVFVNGMAGIERRGRYRVGQYQMTQRTIYLQHKEHTFVLNFAVRTEHYATYEPIYDRMIHTFNLVPAEEL
jgi:hypothetical protein